MRRIKNIGDVETLPIDIIVKQPIQRNIQVLFSHIGRYVIAARKLKIEKRDTVADISCGEGYGTFYLSTLCKKAYGLDVNKDNLELSKKNFNSDNLIYIKYFDLMKQRGSVNKIVCIETFEHIEREKQNEFVKRIMYILKVNGSMFLTVPIGQNKASLYNPFHKNEPSIGVVYDMFKPYFKKIDIEISSFVNSYNMESTYALVTLLEKKGEKE